MAKTSINPYSFKFIEGEIYTYLFTTSQGAAYAVKFKPTPYLFGRHPELGEQIYELVIELLRLPSDKLRLDPAIAPTIASICKDFFIGKERILLYICETADARHYARVRKFNAWYYEFKDGHFLKIDASFPDTSGVTYYVSLIFSVSHPQRHTIIDEFDLLAQQYTTDK